MRAELKNPDLVISYNAQVGRDPQQVVNAIRKLIHDNPKVDAICLQEAETYIEVLRRHFNGGWYLYCHDGWTESAENPVMVRKDEGFPMRTYKRGWGTVRNMVHWEGPLHGLDHPGRTWTWVKVGRLYVMSLHRATEGTDKNKNAYREEALSMARFIRIRPDKPIVVFGDTNTGFYATHAGSMRQVRQAVAGRLIGDEDDPGIDYALVSSPVRAKVKRTKNYGSDHEAAVMSDIRLR